MLGIFIFNNKVKIHESENQNRELFTYACIILKNIYIILCAETSRSYQAKKFLMKNVLNSASHKGREDPI